MSTTAVLLAHQSITDSPTKRVKTSAAKTFVRRGTHEWIEKPRLCRELREPLKIRFPKTEIRRGTMIKSSYQHHIEPRIIRVDRRKQEMLERYEFIRTNPLQRLESIHFTD